MKLYESCTLDVTFDEMSHAIQDDILTYVEEKGVSSEAASALYVALTVALSRFERISTDNHPHFYLMSLSNPGVYLADTDLPSATTWVCADNIGDLQDVVMLGCSRDFESRYSGYIGSIQGLIHLGTKANRAFDMLPPCLISDLKKAFAMASTSRIPNFYYSFQNAFHNYIAAHKDRKHDIEENLHDASEALADETHQMAKDHRHGFLYVNASLDPRGIYRNAYETTIGQAELDHILAIVSISNDLGEYDIYVGTMQEMLQRMQFETYMPINFDYRPMAEQVKKLAGECPV